MQTWKRKLDGMRPEVNWDELTADESNSIAWNNGEWLIPNSNPVSTSEWTSEYMSRTADTDEEVSALFRNISLTREQIRNLYREMMEIDGSGDEIVPAFFQVLVDRSMIR